MPDSRDRRNPRFWQQSGWQPPRLCPGWEDISIRKLARAIGISYNLLRKVLVADTETHRVMLAMAHLLEMDPVMVFERTLLSANKLAASMEEKKRDVLRNRNAQERYRNMEEDNEPINPIFGERDNLPLPRTSNQR